MASVFLIALVGCSAPPPAPGVTYNVSAVTKGPDGKAKLQGEVVRVAGGVVSDVAEVTHDGCIISVEVRKTSYGKATFAITFPDKSRQTVALKSGDSKDILPKGQKVGVHLEVQEAR